LLQSKKNDNPFIAHKSGAALLRMQPLYSTMKPSLSNSRIYAVAPFFLIHRQPKPVPYRVKMVKVSCGFNKQALSFLSKLKTQKPLKNKKIKLPIESF
jgi:hypothetical protein